MLTVVGAGVAHAQPKPAAPAKPTAPVCMPSYGEGAHVVVSSGSPVVCWPAEGKPEKCIAVSQTEAPKYVPVPVKVAQTGPEIRDEAGTPSACNGTKCKKLGKKVLAAIAKAKSEAKAVETAIYVEPAVKVSPDLKVIVVDRTAFSLAGDKPLKLKAPKEYKKQRGDKPSGGSVDIVGNLLTSSWSNCAGPCGMEVVIDSNGNNKGPWYPSGYGYVLDDKRVVIVPSEAQATVTVLEVATAKQLGTLKLDEGVLEFLIGGVIDPQTMVALWPDSSVWRVQWISLAADKAPSVIGAAKTIPTCP